MLEGNTKPLVMADRVLNEEAMLAVRRSPFTNVGWKILDRWAMNSPDKLLALQAQGLPTLLERLRTQQAAETAALMMNAELHDLAMPEHEALQHAGIETELL